MTGLLSRRTFLATGALAAGAASLRGQTRPQPETGPIKLGLCSYTLRNFTRAQVIADMRQLQVTALNAKDVKDHLPMDPVAEAAAVADYTAAGIRLHALGALYFPRTKMTTYAPNSSTPNAPE